MTQNRPAQHQLKLKYRSVMLATGLAVTVGFSSIAGLHLISPIQAQVLPPQATPSALTLTAIPPRVGDDGKLMIKPGEKKQISVKVRNASSQTLRVDSAALDFILDEDGETPVALTDSVSNRWSLAQWMVLSPTSQILEPNELGLVNVVIDVPADALPGGHYAMIVHRPSTDLTMPNPDEIGNSASSVNQRVGSLLYVVVEGPINEEAFITNLEFPQLTEFGPVPYSFSVENVSDIHITPRTVLEITDIFGKQVHYAEIESKNVFPLMKRNFSGTWERIWGTGRYQAKITMSFGSTGEVVVASTYFWLLPYRLVAAVLAALLILIIIIFFLRRQWVRRHQLMKQHLAELEKKVEKLERPTDRT